MKKLIAILLIFTICLSFACAPAQGPASAASAESAASAVSENTAEGYTSSAPAGASSAPAEASSAPIVVSSAPSKTSAVSSKAASSAPASSAEASSEAVTYPYLDAAGYWHYQIRLNGELLQLKNDALLPTKDNSENEILYPFSEILDHFSVAYYWNKTTDDFSTVINGVKVSRDCNDGTYMWFSTQTDGYGNTLKPCCINGVFYAPNYAFEHTIGAKLTKISKGAEGDRAYVDITTSGSFTWGAGSVSVTVMRWDGDCYTGDDGSSGGGSSSEAKSSAKTSSSGRVICTACGGTGRITCTACGGSGMAWTNQTVYDPITHMTKTQTVQTTCWACGGTRYKVCTACGGDGYLN